MPQLTNKEVEKVYPGPSGTNQYGDWQLYNLYFQGGTKKFGYMQSGKKPIPVVGSKISFLDFEITETQKDGKTYENYKIKEMKFADGSPLEWPSDDKPDAPQPTPSNSKQSYINHGEVILRCMELSLQHDKPINKFIHWFKEGEALLLGLGEEKPKDEPEEGFGEEPPPFEEEIPY